MKIKLLYALTVIACALSFALPAEAQLNGSYQIIPAASSAQLVFPTKTTNTAYIYIMTNGVLNATSVTNLYGNPGTSTNLVFNVADYDYAGLTWGNQGNTSTNYLLLYRSCDYGVNFESAPGWLFTNAPGNTMVISNIVLDLHGASTLAIVAGNAGVANATNILELNLKANRIQVQPAGINNGTSPGTPRAVPNFP